MSERWKKKHFFSVIFAVLLFFDVFFFALKKGKRKKILNVQFTNNLFDVRFSSTRRLFELYALCVWELRRRCVELIFDMDVKRHKNRSAPFFRFNANRLPIKYLHTEISHSRVSGFSFSFSYVDHIRCAMLGLFSLFRLNPIFGHNYNPSNNKKHFPKKKVVWVMEKTNKNKKNHNFKAPWNHTLAYHIIFAAFFFLSLLFDSMESDYWSDNSHYVKNRRND